MRVRPRILQLQTRASRELTDRQTEIRRRRGTEGVCVSGSGDDEDSRWTVSSEAGPSGRHAVIQSTADKPRRLWCTVHAENYPAASLSHSPTVFAAEEWGFKAARPEDCTQIRCCKIPAKFQSSNKSISVYNYRQLWSITDYTIVPRHVWATKTRNNDLIFVKFGTIWPIWVIVCKENVLEEKNCWRCYSAPITRFKLFVNYRLISRILWNCSKPKI